MTTSADAERSRKYAAIDGLATMTRMWRMEDDRTVDVFVDSLEDYNADIVAEAASLLGQSEASFPTLSTFRDKCAAVIKGLDAHTLDTRRTAEMNAYLPISQPRAELWVEHLKACLLALKHGRPSPPPPEVFDSTDRQTTFLCANCSDNGWELWHCPGGHARTCNRDANGHFIDGAFYASCRIPHTVAKRCPCRLGGSR